ncbi:class I SAM-dependent methyltransferase [Methyloversatilis sp.]|uniref:class I SAM-dependent methyltransferase n=1 Tax=Methyloversatilis sp. TaxID=2569862 RepID=UPI00273454AB|nr:class I SAM-dependent methyltransferase [Methyloversatilis sp.]
MDASMHAATTRDDAQTALWNGPAGQAWVQAQPMLDAMFAPFSDLLVGHARSMSARSVIDVGCGTGATTLALADVLGEGARCLGVDVSAPMIVAARERAAASGSAARFVCSDAAHHAFVPAGADLVVSRFGIMFFDDPVAAFAHLHNAVRAGGALSAIAWRGTAENLFMTAAERAAAPLLPALKARRPGASGQFAFADRTYICEVLERSGWQDVDISPLDIECTLPLADLEAYFTLLGPVGLALRQTDAATRAKVIETLHEAFQPWVQGASVHFTAACWRIDAGRLP